MKIASPSTSTSRVLVLSFAFLLLPSLFALGQDSTPEGCEPIEKGKSLFKANCAACHKLNQKAVGPALAGIEEKYEKEWLYRWIRNGAAMIQEGDPQAVAIWEEYNRSPMTYYPQFSDEDIDNILAYIAEPTKCDPKEPPPPPPDMTSSSGGGGISNDIILFALALIFVVLIALLYVVTKTLRRIAEANGIEVEPEVREKRTPVWKLIVENQFLMVIFTVFLLLSAAYYSYGYLMQVGVDQGYMPIQPIHYSHKIHAGANQIECKYCHSSARVSKHSGIPSLNVCMNCHQYIAEYNGEEDLANGYDKEFYTNEIKKLYKAVGWDEVNQQYTGKTEPVKWVRIHNLPDFVYFNHAQHVTVAGVECQTCHGPVEEMEILYQYSPLTMGWCINCHRETNVDLANNEYYAKIHEELSKKYGVEKLTAAQMGALECGKCHY